MSLRRLLRQSVRIEHVARKPDGDIARTPDGKPTYRAPATYPARVDGNVQMVRTAAGEERASSTTISLAGDVPVGLSDRLTLPDGTSPPIIAIGRTSDRRGADFLIQLFT